MKAPRFLSLVLVAVFAVARGMDEVFPGNATTAQLEFCKGRGDSFGFRLPGKSCEGSAPVMRMEAGKTYRLILRNMAPKTLTNIHTHGLHISSGRFSDDITRSVSYGNCLVYVYEIPHDHSDGTYFYHAHHHGDTFSHVDGGAFGLLLIERRDLSRPAPITKWLSYRHSFLVSTTSVLGETINGKSSETITIPPNTWQYLQLAHSNPKATKQDFLFDRNHCNVHIVAYDGAWRSSVPGPEVYRVNLTGSSRVDLAIKCSFSSKMRYTGSSKNLKGNPILKIKVGKDLQEDLEASPYANPHTFETWKARDSITGRSKFHHLAELRNISEVVSYDLELSNGLINGESWDANTAMKTLTFNTVHEWTISGCGMHKFHMHLYHMQAVSPCGNHEIGEFYDTISGEGNCTVRFATRDVGGRAVLHCHVLNHEDSGMMVWANVEKNEAIAREEPSGEYACFDARDSISEGKS